MTHARYFEDLRERLHAAFKEDHTPREIAGSFALGTFVTMLPTFGIGLVLFAVFAYVFEWVSKLALLATVLIFNPMVKWGVYVASYVLGSILLAPSGEVELTQISLSASREVLLRLVVGNLILASLGTVVGYIVVYRFAVRFEPTDVAEALEEAVDEIVDEVLEP